jgi:hypothetical protein
VQIDKTCSYMLMSLVSFSRDIHRGKILLLENRQNGLELQETLDDDSIKVIDQKIELQLKVREEGSSQTDFSKGGN